jgi:hypothetical protein
MSTENSIFKMPFDESDGATTAYDYSSSRADGVVTGAHFVAGKNGNAISFAGNDTCEVSKNVLSNLAGDFSIFAWVQPGTRETGSPSKLIWLVNFAGLENYIEVALNVKPGSWYNIALAKHGAVYNFYVNSGLVKSVTKTGTPTGIALNQDCYSGNYGFGLLDDVKIFNKALSQNDLMEEVANVKDIAYLVDGIDFKTFNVFVSGSDGILNRPKLKAPTSISWDNYHGESVDLMHKFYEPREITLSCFKKAASRIDFITELAAFERQFDKQGTQRLTIDVHPVKPLIYEVYCKDAIEITKEWNDQLMVGTFKLKLIEPEPVKRVLKHICVDESTKTCTITITTRKYVNIYWGDGTVDYDVSGTDKVITHDYAVSGDYFPVVTGCIDEITKFETNAIVVWEKI